MAHLMRFCPAWGIASWLMLFVPGAEALDVTLSAQYLGKASGQFENTTPLALFCRRFAYRCTNNDVVDVPLTYTKEVTTASPRAQFFIQMPGRRQIDVFHEVTGEPHTVSFEFSGVSQKTGGEVWYQSPVYNPILQGGCSNGGTIGNPPWVFFLWVITNPASPGGCHSLNNRMGPDYHGFIDVTDMGVSYNLNMPAPFRMKTGIYRGSVTYSVGPGGDFDFGDGVTALSANSVTINLVLDVQHAFFFDFPPGTDRAVLEPRDGWQNWLAGGSVPQRLYRDLPFRLSSSGPFKVYKMCQYVIGARCGIANEQGDQVPVLLSMSLPPGIKYRGQPVESLALPTGRAQALQFEAVQPTLNRPGQMHFEIAKEDVRRMLPNAGSVYTGLATVVFDAEL
ncbi:hypothetical protein [Pseudomonas putida]|uniref:hypothetical protein n=1 Tax=Pseudomonas putida TaxID=303 RepID=UPI001576AA02|nr:hypothetical protein [Pseudomonas putida]MCC9006865.1 hypothetical protein [Pseudomonas putida]